MMTWRQQFARMSKRQFDALQADDLEELMLLTEKVMATLQEYVAAGRPDLHSPMESVENDNPSIEERHHVET